MLEYTVGPRLGCKDAGGRGRAKARGVDTSVRGTNEKSHRGPMKRGGVRHTTNREEEKVKEKKIWDKCTKSPKTRTSRQEKIQKMRVEM